MELRLLVRITHTGNLFRHPIWNMQIGMQLWPRVLNAMQIGARLLIVQIDVGWAKIFGLGCFPITPPPSQCGSTKSIIAGAHVGIRTTGAADTLHRWCGPPLLELAVALPNVEVLRMLGE
jgi:hypothetical protein